MTLLLAPALLALFGEAVWHLPKWLDRILPHVSVEGKLEPEPDVIDLIDKARNADQPISVIER